MKNLTMNKNDNSPDNIVAVIGAGAAGLMAAGVAAKNGSHVLLFEKNKKVGRKIVITGKGRCNVTNNCDIDTLIQNIPQNSRFLYSAFRAFSVEQTMAFFEALGISLKTERGNRVFPVSDNAMDIVDGLHAFVRRHQVKIIQETVTAIKTVDGKISEVVTNEASYAVSKVIIATGGASYPLTGSTGDGYRFAESLGHSIMPLRPSLVPLCAEGKTCPRLQGLSLKNVEITVLEDGKKLYQDFGEMMFTHFGVTGPLILSASSHMRKFGQAKYQLQIDLKPALDRQTLDKRLLSDFSEQLNCDFNNSLSKLLPRKLIPIIVELSGIDPHQKVNVITKQQRESLARLLKCMTLNITAQRSIDEAIITSGGVNVKEVSPKTMASKLVKGLYFAGEVLDVDAYTGGFNLQIAWSTGYLAGMSASSDEN